MDAQWTKSKVWVIGFDDAYFRNEGTPSHNLRRQESHAFLTIDHLAIRQVNKIRESYLLWFSFITFRQNRGNSHKR